MNALTIGEPAPPFTLDDLDGSRISPADFRGLLVLINFWSADCPWAEQADRAILAAIRENGWEEKVVLLSVASNANEPEELLRRSQVERGLPRVLRDPKHQVADLYHAQTTPHCYLIDQDGFLRYQGAFNDVNFRQRTPTRVYVFEAIQALLESRPVPLAETSSYGCTINRYAEEEGKGHNP